MNGNCPVAGHVHPDGSQSTMKHLQDHFHLLHPWQAVQLQPTAVTQEPAESCPAGGGGTWCHPSRTLCLSLVHPRVGVGRMPISVIAVHLVIPNLTGSAWILSKPGQLRYGSCWPFRANRVRFAGGWEHLSAAAEAPAHCILFGTSSFFLQHSPLCTDRAAALRFTSFRRQTLHTEILGKHGQKGTQSMNTLGRLGPSALLVGSPPCPDHSQ